MLNATAQTDADAQGKALLRIGQHILETRTPVALKTGDQLKLLVKTLGETPLLSIQGTTSEATKIARQLRHFIGHQQDITPLLKLAQASRDNPLLPQDVRQRLADLVSRIPSLEQATTAPGLKRIIQNSGIFLENKLVRNETRQIEQDIKNQLLRISTQIRSELPRLTTAQTSPGSAIEFKALPDVINRFVRGDISLKELSAIFSSLPKSSSSLVQQVFLTQNTSALPKELVSSFTQLLTYIQQQANPRQIIETLSSQLKSMPLLLELQTSIDSTLAKITSQQLTPLLRDSDNLLLLLFGLPLKDKNENYLIHFRLEQEKRADDPASSNWLVTLNFEFKSLGPIQAKLHLIENHISTLFQAEKPETAQLIKQQINLLHMAFARAGLEPVSIDVSLGKIDTPKDIPGDSIHILDEKA